MTDPKPTDERRLVDTELLESPREFIQAFFRRAGEFTEELLRENEGLRFRIAQLETEAGRQQPAGEGHSAAAMRELLARIEQLEAERRQIVDRFRAVEASNRDFAERSLSVEHENNKLANLYVALFQLHLAREVADVTQVVAEILLNFIGASVFAMLLVDQESGALLPLATVGLDRSKLADLEGSRGGAVADVLADGQPRHRASIVEALDLDHPASVTPLRLRGAVVGVLAIWQYLPQKTALQDTDRELFDLLAVHAAPALLGAKVLGEVADREREVLQRLLREA